ncbi:006L [Invertebrate iridescent virus 6]|uniref:Putative KilA-N domain-containing protein 006L n=1 Tax=Invertebrate iridescent virus 6 TaxID=176652 RepID=006L_IIV6|nr:006L [Invertebrate iridescent virus 6]Q91G88.1 RecName: Full=Putative KilA-N domain-containing protein 006L [Invertebrate iridescent virus 6]AAK81943.1 006L [Invertebrate iridescent virus 6]
MDSLNEVCYEQIKGTFYKGLFGDFPLIVDKKTGCFNATKLCVLGGKRFVDWNKTLRSKKLIQYYETRCDIKTESLLYEIKGDNNDEITKQITGTYLPKEFILDIASWISVEFYDKCNNIIINYFVNEYKTMDKKTLQSKINEVEEKMQKLLNEKEEELQEKNDKIDELILFSKRMEEDRKKDREMMIKQEKMLRELGIHLEDVSSQNNELIEKVDEQVEQNAVLNFKIDNIQNKLEIAVEDRAPQPKQNLKRERFILLKRNDDYYPYYTIRAQDINARSALKRQKNLYNEVSVLLDLTCHPNSKTLYVRVKDELKQKGVVFNLCKVSISNSKINEEELIKAMETINDEKRDV